MGVGQGVEVDNVVRGVHEGASALHHVRVGLCALGIVFGCVVVGIMGAWALY